MIFKQLVTKAPKLFGKIHIIGMRIFKARNLVPKRINLLGAVLCNFLNRRRFINLLTLFKYFNLKLFGNKIGYDLALQVCSGSNISYGSSELIFSFPRVITSAIALPVSLS